MKRQLQNLWNKVVENKNVLIPIAAGVAGALIGAGITAAIINAQDAYVVYDGSLDEFVADAAEQLA